MIDWSRVETVMLDMDGTLLDLAFDNWFWQTHIPERYAAANGLSIGDSHASLTPRFIAEQGTLNWYCLHYWTRELGLDVIALKEAARKRIGLRPSTMEFLESLNANARRPWLVTNAHGSVLGIKLAETGIAGHFEKILSSHDFAFPKERAEFWDALQAAHPFDPATTLFVDDSFPVLQSARDWGIGQVVGILEPDSSNAQRESNDFALLGDFRDHLPN